MFFELPWVGVAMDAMAVAIHIKYALSLNPHITFYYYISTCTFCTGLNDQLLMNHSVIINDIYVAQIRKFSKWSISS